MIRYNFSGHPVDHSSFAPWVGSSLPLTAAELEAEVRRVVMLLPDRELLLRGAQAEIDLPGHSIIAALLLAEWHGQFGSWPMIHWHGPHNNDGSVQSQVLDLNLVRERGREARSNPSNPNPKR